MTVRRGVGLAAAILLLTGCGTGVRVAHPEAGPTARATATTTAPVSLAPPEPSVSAPRSAAATSPRAPRPDQAAPAPSASDRRIPGPDLSRRTPIATPRPTRRSTTPTTDTATTGRPTSTTIRIGDWSSTVVRGDQAEVDACRNAVQWTGPNIGTENGYELRTVVIVGHDYCGFDRFATLRAGTRVTLNSPRGTWTYTVYAHYVTPGRGVPAAGLYWGDLTLQSCVGPDTGFSYLMRD
ncbi:hypothetical protein SAMN05216489_06367 [Streptomyces sp. 3213]|uniref:hypothetical protein n=1 Tax=Streptomyces sp. 3213.3 TaxID=1855348 RepID=UPI00089B600F|nr:hypothetical protein [Streptomyces sp. 3213.3]SEE37054.1 hypothetical protein SAMN05216489_06367 [Streptomyces sp. 3213] [Streptomyces sp. 3213.3]